jgi:hypothetical protein
MRNKIRRGVTGARKAVIKAMLQLHHQFDAIRLDQHAPSVERINVNLGAAGLEPAQKMSRQADAGHRQPQPPGQQQIEQAQADGVADAAIEHASEVAVFRVVEILLVACELQFAKKIIIDDADDLIDRAVQVQALAQLAGIIVQQSGIGLQIRLRILRAAKQQHALLKVKVFALIEAERQELRVGFLAGKVIHDFAGAPAQNGIAAQCVLAHPIGTGRAVGEDGRAHRAIHLCVVVRQQADQSFAMPFLQFPG